jgi:hypothetical protein
MGSQTRSIRKVAKMGSFPLTFAFFQFVELCNKIETMKMEM